MPDPRRETARSQPAKNGPADERRRYILKALQRPRTQSELRDALGMSNSGILHLLRRMERDGLVRPAERVCCTRIWERSTAVRRDSRS